MEEEVEDLKMYRVLVADDERLERMAVRQVLDCSFKDVVKIYEAENGRKAMEIMEEHEIHIAILDIKMPGVSGVDVARELSTRYPKCKIIMLTGFAYFIYAKECIRIGVMEFLVKPFLDEELEAVVQKAIALMQDNVIEKNVEIPQEESDDWVVQIKRLIEKRYTKEISMEEMANEVGFSTYYFSRMFKQEFGVNFVDYVTSLRLKKACELLQEGNCSVKEVCFKVGYSEPNYFTRVFKKAYGIAPTKFQKTNERSENAQNIDDEIV